MTGESAATSADRRDSGPTRAARAETSAPIEILDRLRDALHRRLDQIEALASEQAALLTQEPGEREVALRARVAALEAAHSRLLAEGKRREQESQVSLRQLEADRHLLAEAWERLEREQIEAQAKPRPHGQAAVEPPPVRQAAPVVQDESVEAVSRAILGQFQALKNDVRRNTRHRGRG